MGTHTQNSFAGDFLTFFDAGTIIRFLRMPSCALSIKGHTGVLTLNEESNFFNRANPGERIGRRNLIHAAGQITSPSPGLSG